MPLTPAGQHRLQRDLEKIMHWADCLPIDTGRRQHTPDTGTIHATASILEPIDPEALQHSHNIDLAQAVIASTTEYWLWDQPDTTMPPELETVDNDKLATTQARCLQLIHNIHILANHPNIDRIDTDIALGADAIDYAQTTMRLTIPEPQDPADPRHTQPLHHVTAARSPRTAQIHIADDYDATGQASTGQYCPHCHLELPATGICDCTDTTRKQD